MTVSRGVLEVEVNRRGNADAVRRGDVTTTSLDRPNAIVTPRYLLAAGLVDADIAAL